VTKLDVVILYRSGWLEAVILKWNWQFHHLIPTVECDFWGWQDDDTRDEFKASITETLNEHGYEPNFIEYDPTEEELRIKTIALLQHSHPAWKDWVGPDEPIPHDPKYS
jgi:hypothetical protein